MQGFTFYFCWTGCFKILLVLPLFASSATSGDVVVINDHLRSAGPSQKLLSKFALQGIKLPVCT